MSNAVFLSDGGSAGSAATEGFAADGFPAAAGFCADGAGATLPLPFAAEGGIDMA